MHRRLIEDRISSHFRWLTTWKTKRLNDTDAYFTKKSIPTIEQEDGAT
jgi:hypothetical protein